MKTIISFLNDELTFGFKSYLLTIELQLCRLQVGMYYVHANCRCSKSFLYSKLKSQALLMWHAF